MTPAIRRILVGLTIALTSAAALGAVGRGQTHSSPPAAPQKKVKGAAGQPWPDAATIEARRAAAESRKLFSTDEPLPFTLTADFKAIDNDKDAKSTKVYQGAIEFAGPDGQPKDVPIEIRPRGQSRRVLCSFVPLRLMFPKEQVKGTVFDGISSIKLGVHCKNEFEELLPREYAAYRINNLLTPRSFRVRLAHASYVDAKTKKPMDAHLAMFIEEDEDVARRLGGRLTDQQGLKFTGVDLDTITELTLFEYMISNHDISLFAQHNIRVVEVPTGVKYPVPYDLDEAGLVDAPYAVPPPILHLDSVKDRLYRGPCRPAAELEPILANFQSVKPMVMALFDTLPMMKNAYRADAKKFLEGFYHTLDQPGAVKKAFTDCKNVAF
jgi:hypothetical protein